MPVGWPRDVRVAVSLTYDGALPEHLDVVGPTLQHLGLRGTFFLDPARTLENVQAWEALSEAGHEMGNGSLLGVSDDGRLPNWTLRMVEQDLHMTQGFFGSIFSQGEPTSFAYPGRVPMCSQGSYRGVVNAEFINARSAVHGANRPSDSRQFLKVRDIGSYSQEELQTWRESVVNFADDPKSEFVWHVLKFGKMFYGESNGALMIHELVASFLASQQERIWVAPLHTVAEAVAANPNLTSSR